MLTSTPEFKAVLRMLHDSGREVTPDELMEFLGHHKRCIRAYMCIRLADKSVLPWHQLVLWVDTGIFKSLDPREESK